MCDPASIAAIIGAVGSVGGAVAAATQKAPHVPKIAPLPPPQAPTPSADVLDKPAGVETAQARAARLGTAQLKAPSTLGTIPPPKPGTSGLFLNLPK